MIIDCVERYIIEKCAHGIIVRMRQGRQALALSLLSLAVLLASWWFGPYGPQPSIYWAPPDRFYWIWSGFFSLVFLLGLVGPLYQENSTITEQEIVVSKSLGPWCRIRRVSRARSLGVRVEIMPWDSSTGKANFPYRICFLDSERKDSGLRILLQLPQSVDRFLKALHPAITLDVEDPRMGKANRSDGRA